MQFKFRTEALSAINTACLVVGVGKEGAVSDEIQQLDDALQSTIGELLNAGDIKGKPGETLLIPRSNTSPRVLLLGFGQLQEIASTDFIHALEKGCRVLKGLSLENVCFALDSLSVVQRSGDWQRTHCGLICAQQHYRYEQTRSKTRSKKPVLQEIGFWLGSEPSRQHKDALLAAEARAHGVATARTLGNLPGNVCTPTHLAEQALELASRHDRLRVDILEQGDMEELGMGALLSVAKGSREAPKFIIMHYRNGKPDEKPLLIVGKGITFDSGGISLKPGAAMDEMKFDMCGAAAVMGSMQAVCEMALEINITALIPSCENMPDGLASKPGDVVTAMDGTTIEVLNTDAEGRLILCDALCYAQRFEPELIIDMATLTGACVVALGHHASGLFSNDDTLAEQLLTAGEFGEDRAWRLPLWKVYEKQIRSPFADLANIGGRAGGAVTAAAFLHAFVKKQRWAHLDIAGTAWKSDKAKGATGRPVSLLVEFLERQARHKR